MQRPYLAISHQWIEIQGDEPCLIRFDRDIETIIETDHGIAVYVAEKLDVKRDEFKHTDRGYVCMYGWSGVLIWRKPSEGTESIYEKQIVGLSTRSNGENHVEIGLVGYDCFTYYVDPKSGELIEKVEGR